jgi:hypothetical protein
LLTGLPAAARAEQHLHRGKAYLDKAQWYAAQGELIEYVRRQPNDDIGHLELARTYRLTGRHTLADQHYRDACRPAIAAKRWDRVESIYREAERGHAKFCLEPGAQLHLGKMRERSLDTEGAMRAYLRVADAHPEAGVAPVALCHARRLAARHPRQGWRLPVLEQRLLACYPDSPEAALFGPAAVHEAA